MIKAAVVGLGKMGLSHLAMLRATPGVQVVAICDSSGYLLGMLNKYAALPTYTDFARMLDEVELDAVLIATPSGVHATMVQVAIDHKLHVFCEKPFGLDPDVSAELTLAAKEAGVVTQVGYHNRFVGTFREVKSLLDQGAIGDVTHIMGEAYGPVVLKPQGASWRSNRAEGGGCLYDYAAHPLNLVNWYLGEPVGAGGTILNSVFSRDTDDEVFTNLFFDGGQSAQLSVNWSDESVRKMTTRITVWGTGGRIFADRQECQVYLRTDSPPAGYRNGWNVRYTTELTQPVAFYLRGEEYSAQLEAFARRIASGHLEGDNDFASATVTDRAIALMRADALRGAATTASSAAASRIGPVTPGPQLRVRWTQRRRAIASSDLADRSRAGIARVRSSIGEMRGR